MPADLITLFQQQNPQLFEQRVAAASGEAGPVDGEVDWEALASSGGAANGAAAQTGANGQYRTQWSAVKVA